ncbi:sensor histidine kinase [Flavihumibacter sp. UBA7668]|uniref:sensor histidine kinase n=1 Tax=Flavihumibacter sp. UBA7668 TaxID=1946542 RepID=UPI0025C2EF1B|nr:HAMP domain-containing sensor histidine kinase [Flavihumibacter sp. UBA7668]
MRIQTKTGILFTIITATIILIISWTSYFITRSFVSRDFFKRLEIRVIVATKVLFEQDHITTNTYQELRKKYLETLTQEKEYVFRVDTIYKLKDRKTFIPYSFLQNIVQQKGIPVYFNKGDIDFAGLFYPDETGDYIVIKSAVNEYGISTLENLRNIKIATFILAVIIVYTTSIFFSKKTFEPVRDIIERTKNISAYNLGLRLEDKGGGDEIAELAKTFNNMLDRLQTAFETQNNFISNASHELRTPLTNIVGEADWALTRTRSMEEYQQSITSIQKHADHLNKITSELLSLSQISFTGQQQEWEEIGVVELIEESAFSVKNLIKGTELNLDIAEEIISNEQLSIKGIRTLLKLALGNIIANGAKYSNQEKVDLRVNKAGQFIEITIVDRGIGIPANEISRVFEPFFRASNTKSFEGYGVGLPLALNIIRIHHGNIEVKSIQSVGTSVIITLPVNKNS